MNINTHLERARFLTRLLDTRFNFFGIHFGIDPLLSLIPGVGSALGAATSAYILWIAANLNLPKEVYAMMLLNIIVDFILGWVPGVGVILDVFYKSNLRNLRMIENHIGISKSQVSK